MADGPCSPGPVLLGVRVWEPWQHSEMGTERLEHSRGLGVCWEGCLEGGNSMVKTQGALSACWELRGPEEKEVSGDASGNSYSTCGSQFTGDPAVVSIMGTGRYPTGF